MTHRVFAFLARAHGLAGFDALLGARDRFALVGVATHQRRPRSEDPRRGERDDFADYAERADLSVPLHCVDSRAQAQALNAWLEREPIDLFAAISWRRLIRPAQLAIPRLGGVNLHRGALPRYAGAEPVRRALEDGERVVEICAHILVEDVDAGPVLCRVRHPVGDTDSDAPLHVRTERIKRELTPHFGPLLLEALDALIARKHVR